ncbi:carbon storage regulator CsrA [Pseudomonas sp. MPB26]|uniref:carbon storage regulator CsrA n=1 Tax=Pseudomonas sp. MPB26 TaxID=3388491 RepID=UPI00398556CF
MLVLSRTVGEAIAIGDDITVRILELNGTQVKIGVEAPAGVQVHRAEVYHKILKRQAAELQAAPTP